MRENKTTTLDGILQESFVSWVKENKDTINGGEYTENTEKEILLALQEVASNRTGNFDHLVAVEDGKPTVNKFLVVFLEKMGVHLFSASEAYLQSMQSNNTNIREAIFNCEN